jgi:hypothetical protein
MKIKEIVMESEQKNNQEWKPITSLVLGILSMLAWCIPLCGAPVTIAGLVLGIMGLNSTKRNMAIAGIVLSSIGLVLTIVNGAYGAYLGYTGQHPLFQ